MDSNKRQELEQRRERLKQKIQINGFMQRTVKHWLSIYNELKSTGTDIQIEYLVCSTAGELELYQEVLQESWGFIAPELSEKVAVREDHYIHGKMYQLFPNTLPLRYLPQLQHVINCEDDYGKALQQAKADLQLTDQPFFVLYNQYAPVISLPFDDIVVNADILVDHPIDDVALMSTDYITLIYKSMENEWTWGRR